MPRVYSPIGRGDFIPLLTSALLGQWISVTSNLVSSEEVFLHYLGQGAVSSKLASDPNHPQCHCPGLRCVKSGKSGLTQWTQLSKVRWQIWNFGNNQWKLQHLKLSEEYRRGLWSPLRFSWWIMAAYSRYGMKQWQQECQCANSQPCLPRQYSLWVCSVMWLFATPWMVACQAPLSMGFSSQEYQSELLFPSQGIFPTQRSNPCLLHLLHCRQILYH